MLPHTRFTRLFGVLAHVDAGKTTLSERMLLFSGRIHRAGEVHHGDTTLDFTPEERSHGITISAAATTFDWPHASQRHRLTLIDTPGHIDFAVEVERALRVLDGAVIVLDAARGVEPQTEAVWRRADDHRLPRIVFVNKVDAVGASVPSSLESLKSRLGVETIWLQSLTSDGGLRDLVTGELLHFTSTGACTRVADGSDEGRRERDALIERLSEHDEVLLSAWVSGLVTAQQLAAAVRRVTLRRALVPVLAGSALKNFGVQPVLDAVAAYLPSPLERPAVAVEPREDGPTCAFVFKTEVDAHAGALAWARVFRGVVKPGHAVLVPRTGHTERVSRVLALHGESTEPLQALGVGGIAALSGLKDVRTGDTLCDVDATPVVLEVVQAAEPVVELAIEPQSSSDLAKLSAAVHRACFEDPSLRARVDEGTGQLVLRGVGELHLTIWLEKLERRHGLHVRAGNPSVSWRDTLEGTATVTYRNVHQTGGPGRFAVVTLSVAPAPRGTGLRFVDLTKGGTIPSAYIPAVDAGVRGAMERGLRDGVPVIDVEVQLLEGQTHVKDSSAQAFEVAGSLAFQQAALQAGLVRLEPLVDLRVSSPAPFLGAVLGELASRRASVSNVSVEGSVASISSRLGVSRTFGLVSALRSRSEGRADASMSPAGYERVS